MGRVTTNSITLASAREQSLGVLPATPNWRVQEPNGIGRFGTEVSKTARSPISKARQRRKGVVTSVASGVEFDADLTWSAMCDFLEGFMFSRMVGADIFIPTATTAGAVTIPALTAAQAGRLKYAAAGATTLLAFDGFSLAANQGLKELGAAAATNATSLTVAGLVAETPPATADVAVFVAGVRAAAGDLQIDAQGNLISTALDLSSLGLVVGQSIHVGGRDVSNQFANAANTGFARIRAITATKLTLDRKATTFVADTGAGVRVDLLFGKYVRNVDVGHADYLEVSTMFELSNPNLGAAGQTMYEYAQGNYHDALSINIPLTDKVTTTFGFVGTDTTRPSVTRATGAANAKEPGQTSAYSSSSDLARLRVMDVDEAGLSTDFKSLTITLSNNVSAEMVLGRGVAKYMNPGNFEVDLEGTLLFTNADVVGRVRDNKDVGLDFVLKNGDGGFLFDVPVGTLGGGGRSYPVGQSVTIASTLSAHKDDTLGCSLSVSFFPVLPASAAV